MYLAVLADIKDVVPTSHGIPVIVEKPFVSLLGHSQRRGQFIEV
jgi:hypothetical protein